MLVAGIPVNRMATVLEGDTGKCAGGGRVTAQGRCGGISPQSFKTFFPEDGGSRFVQNIVSHILDYIVS